ncbi:MAG: EAL domain-containing protein [Burkholderiaceae bacterium]|nr:EAL domain-containing protein [Rhodoferax sp.]MCP5270018.1 EAL domain-containing protein [Burkholderiaceae bacterium]
MPETTPARTFGRGIHSIRWRFALASAVLTASGLAAFVALSRGPASPVTWGVGSVLVLGVAWITWLMASRLTASIDALRRSTEAIAAGDVNRPVDVDCACEVGGLADSFRKMTSRLNANILRINALAYTDAITGLPNRSVVEHLLGYALDPARAGTFRGALVFVDLDGFKRVNDALGHDGGDELLRAASQRLLETGLGRTLQTIDHCTDPFGNPCSRLPEDVVFARYAGDEFIAILPGVTDRTELAAVGQRLIAALAAPFRIRGQDVTVGASVGIAVAPEDTVNAAELINFADLAMYDAKQAGRGRCRFFDQRIREAIVERTRTEADLRRALAGEELQLHFQPKVGAATGTLCGVEALVRWRHPQRGLLMPAAFIDVAEHAGLMGALGERVLRLAVRQCRTWLDQGARRPVAVNVSPTQFGDPAFVPGVLASLREAGVPPSLLTIEITETMAMQDFEATAQRLAALRAAGVRISIDDFGIGFSNLSQLARLPVDELKIDRSLIQEIGRSAKSEAIIRATVGMARGMGFRTVAEGIETPAQRDFVAALGCDVLQGWLFGRPNPASAYDVAATTPAAAAHATAAA